MATEEKKNNQQQTPQPQPVQPERQTTIIDTSQYEKKSSDNTQTEKSKEAKK